MCRRLRGDLVRRVLVPLQTQFRHLRAHPRCRGHQLPPRVQPMPVLVLVKILGHVSPRFHMTMTMTLKVMGILPHLLHLVLLAFPLQRHH